MDINGLLKGINCSCGKIHTCDIDYVYIENGAINHLKDILKNHKNILIVADENTFSAAGEQTVNALDGKKIEKVIFTGKKILVPNEEATETVMNKIADTDMIVGIGSGVIQDLCKYVSHLSNVPYLVVATAPSMDGYASDGAAMILGGMKVTVKSGLPRALIADTTVLKNAPMEMIQAGYGDIIGKFSALNDWKLSKIVNSEYFCQYIYDLTFKQIEETLKLSEGIKNRDEQSIKTLMEALVVVGILMSFAGSSRPASGSEHHLSHFFEITGIIENTPYFSHGIDVAYSTVITASIREKIRETVFPEKLFRLDRKDYEATMEEIYNQVAPGCIELQDKIGNYNDTRLTAYIEKEAQIKEILNEMPSAKEIEQMLQQVGLDINDFYAHYSQEKIKNAILYAKDLKDRYSVLWLNYDLFGDK